MCIRFKQFKTVIFSWKLFANWSAPRSLLKVDNVSIYVTHHYYMWIIRVYCELGLSYLSNKQNTFEFYFYFYSCFHRKRQRFYLEDFNIISALIKKRFLVFCCSITGPQSFYSTQYRYKIHYFLSAWSTIDNILIPRQKLDSSGF